MTLLTDKQREEVVEAMARAVFLRRNGMATCWSWDEGGLDDEHPGAREQYLKDATAALTAALPAIERAVLEKAAMVAEDAYTPSDGMRGVELARNNEGNMRGVAIARAIRALAEEVK